MVCFQLDCNSFTLKLAKNGRVVDTITMQTTLGPSLTPALSLAGDAAAVFAWGSEAVFNSKQFAHGACAAPELAREKWKAKVERVEIVRLEASILSSQPSESQLRRQREQRSRDKWHERIHHVPPAEELKRSKAKEKEEKEARNSVYRSKWNEGLAITKEADRAMEEAIKTMRDRNETELNLQRVKRKDAADQASEAKSAACTNCFDASHAGVPVSRLRELFTKELDARANSDECGVFEHLCLSVEGVVLECQHPYQKGSWQTAEVAVPTGAKGLCLVFDSRSNVQAGGGKIHLYKNNALSVLLGDPDGYSPAGRYKGMETAIFLPSPSFTIQFTSSWWKGEVTDGSDWGWRAVAFPCQSETMASHLLESARRTARRSAVANAVSPLGETCLHIAAWTGNAAAVNYLLDAGSDPCACSSSNGMHTPLHEAARAGHLEITKVLLERGANPAIVNNSGDTALVLCCRAGHVRIARELLSPKYFQDIDYRRLRSIAKGKALIRELLSASCRAAHGSVKCM
ncbi:unnamed protein product [Chrysoparadoxa australica]